MNKFIQILWKLFLFTFPFSLHLLLYEKNAYRFGNFNPWVTGFLFLPDILLIGIFLLKIKDFSFKIKDSIWLLILFLLFLLNAGVITFLKGDIILYLFFLFHLFSATLVYCFIKKEIISSQETVRWLLYGALFQVIVAFLQTKFNHSLGLWFLGEPHIGPKVSNVAKIDLSDNEKVIRGYGTFLHPNIFAAYLLSILLVSLPYLKKMALFFWPILLVTGIFLTGSRAAEMVLVGMIFLFLIFRFISSPANRKLFTFGLFALFLTLNAWFFFNSEKVKMGDAAVAERLQQNVISSQMIEEHPWGVGVGNFTLNMEDFSAQKLMPWNFQPVHNVYFLVLTQLGIQGLFIFILMIFFMLNSYFKTALDYSEESNLTFLPFLTLLFLASFDHLFWTSYIGPFLIALVLSQRNVKV